MDGADGSARARLWLALALAAALAVAIVVVLISSGDDDEVPVAAAPADCLREWNRDASAREAGRHVLVFHRYDRAQVGYAEVGGGVSAISDDPAAGPCAVVFPRASIDPEIEYAGFVAESARWSPMSDTTPESALSALQPTALEGANATITRDGELVAG